MSDREKVIKAYECCKNSFDRICEKCPYEKDCCHDGMPMFVIKKMVALLKEQEAVKPTLSHRQPFCGACGSQIRGGKFCSECGRPILWEER